MSSSLRISFTSCSQQSSSIQCISSFLKTKPFFCSCHGKCILHGESCCMGLLAYCSNSLPPPLSIEFFFFSVGVITIDKSFGHSPLLYISLHEYTVSFLPLLPKYFIISIGSSWIHRLSLSSFLQKLLLLLSPERENSFLLYWLLPLPLIEGSLLNPGDNWQTDCRADTLDNGVGTSLCLKFLY